MEDVLSLYGQIKGLPELWRVLRAAWIYLRGLRGIRVLSWGLLALGGLAGLAYPLLYRMLIDQAFVYSDLNALYWVVTALALIKLSQVILNAGGNYLSRSLDARIVGEMSQKAFERILNFPASFFTRGQSGELITLLRSDIGALNKLFSQSITSLGLSLLKFTALIAVLVYLDWQLTLLCFSMVPLVVAHQLWVGPKIRERSKEHFRGRSRINSFIQERLQRIRVIKMYGRESDEVSQYAAKQQQLLEANKKMARFSNATHPLGEILRFSIPVLLWFFGGFKIIIGFSTIGTVLAIYLYLQDLFSVVGEFTRISLESQKYAAPLERVQAVFSRALPRAERADARELIRPRHSLIFKDVSFAPGEGKPPLQELSFKIKKGERLALVGETEAVGAALEGLLFRFFEPHDGQILIDGHDIREVTVASLRKQIGVVSTDNEFFNHTIERNLRYAKPDASPEEIIDVCQKARIHEAMESLPHGYQTFVKAKERQFSDHERLCLSIAQILLKDPAMIILEEPSTSFDPVTEKRVREALKELIKDRITLVVTPRPPTLVSVDTIRVIKEGRIVEEVSQEELLRRGHEYQTHSYNR